MTTPKVPRLASRPNPYCAFRNDRDRLLALVSRDVRIVAVVLLLLIAGFYDSALLPRFLGTLIQAVR